MDKKSFFRHFYHSYLVMCYRKKTEFEVFSLEIPGYPLIKVFANWYIINIKVCVDSNHKTNKRTFIPNSIWLYTKECRIFYQKIWLHSQDQDALIDKTVLYILHSSGLYFTDIRRWFQSHFQVKHWTYLPIAMGNAWTAHKQLDIKVNFPAKRFHMLNWNNNEVWLQDPYEDSITWPDIFIEGHIFV